MKRSVGISATMVAFGLGVLFHSLIGAPPVLPSPPSTTDAEVQDLIARLSPLAREPDGEWYRNGLTIKFSGRHSVDIELKTPDGNEYHGRAPTLQDAARRITEPSVKIRESLQGWQK